MSQQARRIRIKKTRETLSFWLIVLIIAGLFGFLSYRLGRDWLGKQLGPLEIESGAPRIIAQSDQNETQQEIPDARDKAPDKAKVSVDAREPSEVEKRTIQQKSIDGEPQDGAELNAQHYEESTSKPDEEDVVNESKKSGSGKFNVSAGSFEKAENARKQATKLEKKGYTPFIETVTTNGKVYNRVSVATVESRSEANELRDTLQAEGFDAQVSGR